MQVFKEFFIWFLVISFIVQWVILYKNHFIISGLKYRVLQRNMNAFFFSFQAQVYGIVCMQRIQQCGEKVLQMKEMMHNYGIPYQIVQNSVKLLYFLHLTTDGQCDVQLFYDKIEVIQDQDSVPPFKFKKAWLSSALKQIKTSFEQHYEQDDK